MPSAGLSHDTYVSHTYYLPYRSTPKQNRLSRVEIIKVLNDLVLEAPLLDYIVAHGVITSDAALELMQSPGDNTRQIERLLDLLEGDYETPQHHSHDAKIVLLTNALRSTGQHALASQLDCGRKIKPAPRISTKLGIPGPGDECLDFDASSDPSSSPVRRRGQLRLWVQVSAIRVSPAYHEHLLSCPASSDPSSSVSMASSSPISSDVVRGGDAKTRNKKRSKWPKVVTPAQKILETSHGAYFWIDLKSSRICSPLTSFIQPVESPPKPPPKACALSRFLCLLCCVGKQRNRKSSNASVATAIKTPRPSVDYRLPSSILPFASQDLEKTDLQHLPDGCCAEVAAECARQERLRQAKLAVLDAKSNDFYRGLANPLSDAVVKYLEQSLGVLVLGADVEDRCPENCCPAGILQAQTAAASLSILATTCDAVERLHAAVSVPALPTSSTLPPSSTLSMALEAIFKQEKDFLEAMGVQDIRLSVGLEEEELRLAASELEE